MPVEPSCHLCPLRERRASSETRGAFQGSSFDGLAIVGEGPGRQEALERRPFIGPAGKLLDQLLATAGVPRERCYVTNATLCLPTAEDRVEDAVAACRARLLSELEEVKPRAIVALGQHALDALAAPAKHRLGKVAGAVWRAYELSPYLSRLPRSTWIVATYHPAFFLRQPDAQFLAVSVVNHLSRAYALALGAQRDNDRYVVTREPQQLIAYITEYMHDSMFAVDLETDNVDPDKVNVIRCVGLRAEHADYALVVDTEGLGRDHELVRMLCAFFKTPSIRKVLHNAIYDACVIERLWGATLTFDYDTMIAHRAFAPDEPHTLAHVAHTFLSVPPWKDMEVLAARDKQRLYRYNATDVSVTAALVPHCRKLAERYEVERVVEVDLAKARVAVRMWSTGLYIDREAVLARATERNRTMEQALDTMRRTCGPLPPVAGGGEFNPHSRKHLCWALYHPQGPCRLEPTSYTANASPSDPPWLRASTDKGALSAYADHPFVVALREYRTAKAFLDFVMALEVDSEGRIHPQWQPSGARSGRWTSTPNVQNRPKAERAIFAAPPGRLLVGADAAQIELRIAAALAGDAGLIERCARADESRKLEPEHDPHSWIAALAFGSAYTSLSTNDPKHDKSLAVWGNCPCETCRRKALRDLVKRVVYGVNYGASPERVWRAIYEEGYRGPPITLEMMRGILSAYFERCPGVAQWCDRIVREAQETGFVREPVLGRMRFFPLRRVSATEVRNFPIQSAASSIIDLAMLDIEQQLEEVDPTARLVAQLHDALYYECAEDRAPAVAQLVERCMTREVVLDPNAPPMPIVATAHVGRTFKDLA